MNKLGIENYWKVMSFLLALGVDIEQALTDGKINLSDVQYFYKEFLTANTAWASKDDFVKEGLNLDDDEQVEIHKRAKAQLGEDDSEVKIKLASGEKVMTVLFEFFSTFQKKGTQDSEGK